MLKPFVLSLNLIGIDKKTSVEKLNNKLFWELEKKTSQTASQTSHLLISIYNDKIVDVRVYKRIMVFLGFF